MSYYNLPYDINPVGKKQLVVPFEISESVHDSLTSQPKEDENLEEQKVNYFRESGTLKRKWLPASKKTQSTNPQLQTLSSTYFIERRKMLLQMLEAYTDDDSFLITSTPKSTKKRGNTGRKGKPRASKYRGVSKNKAKWQVMIMGNFKKMYFGAIEDEREAALFYDKLAIVSHGIKARTNFNYTRRDILSILNDDKLCNVWNQ